eukprot:SM000116S24199  [mRNA]  locus=s116:62796:65821:+ [translate_table: standard]
MMAAAAVAPLAPSEDVVYVVARPEVGGLSLGDAADKAPPPPPGVRLQPWPADQEAGSEALPPGFRPAEYLRHFDGGRLGLPLLYAPRLRSTQTLLSESFASFPVGTLCIADEQYGGRGRGGNEWVSPAGCLMFSIMLQWENGQKLPFMQYIASLAIVQAVEEVSAKACKQAADLKGEDWRPISLRIKWPNDLYDSGVKVGGVLCTSTYSQKRFRVVIGCGLNVANKEPTVCLHELQKREQPQVPLIEPEELLASIVSHFEHLIDLLASSGFDNIKSAYMERWLHSGQQIELDNASAPDATEGGIRTKLQGKSLDHPKSEGDVSKGPGVVKSEVLGKSLGASKNEAVGKSSGGSSEHELGDEQKGHPQLEQGGKGSAYLKSEEGGSFQQDSEPQSSSTISAQPRPHKPGSESHGPVEQADQITPAKVSLTIQGLTPDGFLLARDEQGQSYALHPDGNSLDFFKGLISRKIAV